FSSRRRHTRFSRDWSSDVCSSDLERVGGIGLGAVELPVVTDTKRLQSCGRRVACAHIGNVVEHDARLGAVDQGGELGGGQVLEEIGRASCRERAERWADAGRANTN